MKNHTITFDIPALALETSGRGGSVALGAGANLSDEKSFAGPMRHSIELFDTISELLKKADKKAFEIKHIYISAGPGSFTGIRIAVTVAKTMALANNTKIVAVSSTDALAANVDEASINKIATIIDAKKGQFFTAVFKKQNSVWQKTIPDCLMHPEEFIKQFDNEPIHLLGEGLTYYADKFKTDNIKILDEKYWLPKAANVFRIGLTMAQAGQFAEPISLVPLYMRKPEAEENWEKRQ